jgi:four helix bundle protein
MSVSNNIAEGSGSVSAKEFANYLNMARRSIFENANILFLLANRKLIDHTLTETLLDDLDLLSRKITSFKRSL